MLPPKTRRTVYIYLGSVMMLMTFSDPNSGLLDIPVSFLLKNTSQLDASQVAQFRLLVSTPLYLSFLFGWVRDNWSPFGLGDRGHLLMFGILSAFTYAAFGFVSASIFTLGVALLFLTACSLFIASAQNGLAAAIAQKHDLTGQISTVWNLFTAVPAVFGFLIGGQISDLLQNLDGQTATRRIFLIGAATSLALVMFALLRPAAVYDQVSCTREHKESLWLDLRTLAKYGPARRALLIWGLWNFAPASATPLQFYLQDVLGGTPVHWGQWNAIFTASFIPTFLVFGISCAYVTLDRLLKCGTLIAIPQFIPLLFVNSLSEALFAAIPIGLMGGLATAAYVALIMRAAPKGLQGTMMMSASAVYFAAARIGDVFGSALYDWFGNFLICIVLSTVIYTSILWVLLQASSEELRSRFESYRSENVRTD